MDDGEQVVSSTTEDEMSRYSQYGNHYGNNEATATFGDDDIVDLVGGAHDAIERHKASYPEDIIKFRKDEEALLTTTTERTTAQLTHDEVIPDSTPSEEELAEIIPAPVILNCLDADSLPELIRPYPPAKAAPEEAGPVLEAAPEEEAAAAPPAPPHDNFLPSAAPQPLMQFPKEHWDSPFLASQDNPRASMDTFTKDSASRGSSGYEPDMLGQSDDDLMFKVKKNPFQGFSPVADAGFSHLGVMTSDSQAAKMSESPTPDLVQYGRAEDSQDGSPPSYYDETKTYESVKMAADSLMEPFNQFSTTPKESEASTLPSLPDILKPFPLNPDKVDSGSSEGSTEPSPAPIRKMVESPTVPVSATNPFAFDSKALLLKELTEETEARLAVKVEAEDEGFSAFDLVKEAEPTPHSKAPVQIEQKDWMFSSQDSPQIVNKLEPLNFQTKTPEDSDSESPSADSLSPVLEAMAKNPASFQVESEKNDMKVEEAAEDISEPEVSSEEFEFIERPLRGVIDEFLEALDSSKFAKATEFSMDEDDMCLGLTDVASANLVPEVQEESPSQRSYHLLTQKVKSDLEKDDTKGPTSKAPLIHSPVRKPELLAKDTGPELLAKDKMDQMPNLSAEAVVELLYWRDVKTSGVVFGAGLSLLLSLTLCSIVSVSSYIALALLSVTICFRIYKGILQAIQKSDEGHPFKLYLDQDVGLSEETVHKYSDCALARFNTTVIELRRLFLVEDLVDSLKFAVLMWILTYVGALFNGLDLLILGLVGLFSFPIIYEKYKVQIDHYVGMANKQVKDIIATVQAKVPGLKRVKAD
ncbi:reticulon-4 isoform X2 [Salvelinus sp. IW2-2015]|uniref:reticulon-4 isoform X2 n=1 Tax=Salvelinus sp. IW2-2015 TaxID=2691554 RepID=UPI000CDF5FCF|nr:reticulon-4 isoform X3 [Salvelinus alpinus]